MNLSIENALAPPLPVACVFVGVLGAMIGSFLNVVIHRLPREQSIVFPNSTCPRCRACIKAYDNIPVLSFLILRGQCRSCGARISPRYPAVEALTALLFAAVTWHDGVSFILAFDLAFTASIVALLFIDAEHMILPNAITYPGILFALITRVVVPYVAGPSHFDDLPGLVTHFPPTWPVPLRTWSSRLPRWRGLGAQHPSARQSCRSQGGKYPLPPRRWASVRRESGYEQPPCHLQ